MIAWKHLVISVFICIDLNIIQTESQVFTGFKEPWLKTSATPRSFISVFKSRKHSALSLHYTCILKNVQWQINIGWGWGVVGWEREGEDPWDKLIPNSALSSLCGNPDVLCMSSMWAGMMPNSSSNMSCLAMRDSAMASTESSLPESMRTSSNSVSAVPFDPRQANNYLWVHCKISAQLTQVTTFKYSCTTLSCCNSLVFVPPAPSTWSWL